MKYFSKYSVVLLASALVLGSCKKIDSSIDINPNSPTTASYPLVLTGAETAQVLVYEGDFARIGGIFARSFTGDDRQYSSFNSYSTTATDYSSGWDNMYANVISQYKIVEAAALAVSDKKTAGIAEINMAMAFGTMADLFGDIPFSQVGNPTTYPNPVFDSQTAVYTGVQTMLTNAIANLAGVGAGPKAKDFYFAGNVASWTQVAYTLKARFYLHTRDYANAIVNAKLGISSPAGDLLNPHSSNYGKDFNIYYSFLVYDRPGYMGAETSYAVKYLNPGNTVNAKDPLYKGNTKTNETARYEYYFTTPKIAAYTTGDPTSPSAYTGLDPNILVDFDWGNPTSLNGFFGATTSFPLVTYAENNLILAEAYAKTGDYNNAVTALNTHRTYLAGGGGTNTGYMADGTQYDIYQYPADFTAGGPANPGTLTTGAAVLTEILKERYVTLTGQIEQFNDVRRTGNYLKIPTSSTTSSVIPQRFFYAQDEINTNPNTPKQGASDLFKPTTANTSAY